MTLWYIKYAANVIPICSLNRCENLPSDKKMWPATSSQVILSCNLDWMYVTARSILVSGGSVSATAISLQAKTHWTNILSEYKADAISNYVLEILQGIKEIFNQIPDEISVSLMTLTEKSGYSLD